MNVQCRLLEHLPEDRLPGDMWFNRNMVEGENSAYYLDHYLSEEYKRDWLGKRPPLFVVLPNGDWFCVDSQAAKNRPHGWTVIGEAPNVTVTPSIHVLEDGPDGAERTRWHGFLTNGVLA